MMIHIQQSDVHTIPKSDSLITWWLSPTSTFLQWNTWTKWLSASCIRDTTCTWWYHIPRCKITMNDSLRLKKRHSRCNLQRYPNHVVWYPSRRSHTEPQIFYLEVQVWTLRRIQLDQPIVLGAYHSGHQGPESFSNRRSIGNNVPISKCYHDRKPAITS